MALSLAHITIDCADPQRVAGFRPAALGRSINSRGSEYFASIGDQSPSAAPPVWFFIRVPEPKSGKNRVHVDLRADDREAEVARLRGLGAEKVSDHDEWGAQWTVLRDVEGNEFCVGQA